VLSLNFSVNLKILRKKYVAWCGVHSYNPNTWEAEVGGLRIQGHLGYIV
jgi:hypothetical protein